MLVLREITRCRLLERGCKRLTQRKEGRRIQDPRPDLKLITRLKNILYLVINRNPLPEIIVKLRRIPYLT